MVSLLSFTRQYQSNGSPPVKGFYVCWTNDPPNPKIKDWNVTELKVGGSIPFHPFPPLSAVEGGVLEPYSTLYLPADRP